MIEHPLFTPFRNEAERMSSTNLFSVTDAAATPELRARFLADAIPAESHAAVTREGLSPVNMSQ